MIRLHTVPELLVLPQALEVRNVTHDKLHDVVVVREFLGHLHLFGVGEEGGEVVDLDERSVVYTNSDSGGEKDGRVPIPGCTP